MILCANDCQSSDDFAGNCIRECDVWRLLELIHVKHLRLQKKKTKQNKRTQKKPKKKNKQTKTEKQKLALKISNELVDHKQNQSSLLVLS